MRFDVKHLFGDINDVEVAVQSVSSAPRKAFFTLSRGEDQLVVLYRDELRDLIKSAENALTFMNRSAP